MPRTFGEADPIPPHRIRDAVAFGGINRKSRQRIPGSHTRGRVSAAGVLVGALLLVGAVLVALSLTETSGSDDGPPQAPLATSRPGTPGSDGQRASAVEKTTTSADRAGSTGSGRAAGGPRDRSTGTGDTSASPTTETSTAPTLLSAADRGSATPPGLATQGRPVQSAGPAPPSGSATPSGPATAVRGPILASSTPIAIEVPEIGAHSKLMSLGLNSDGTVEVPPLDIPDSPAGWYRHSPTPGQLGPSIILGHVDSAKYGPGVFYRLGALGPGDRINITRADSSTAVFEVDRTVRYPKNEFPTDEVYGNIDHAGLRLITCGGVFDPAAGSYQDNTVVYASLASVS